MVKYDGSRYRVTLESLKEERSSLNMLWRLSLQNHDEAARAALEGQIKELTKRIDSMSGKTL